MHESIEMYCVTQTLSGRDSSFFQQGGKDYAAFKLESLFLHKKAVIINNEWFLLHVQNRFAKQIVSMLIKSGANREDISCIEEPFCTKIYVIEHPDKFIPILIEFEKKIVKKSNPI